MNKAAAQDLGGPINSTSTLTVYMFNQLYTYSNYGYAAAVAILLSLIILVDVATPGDEQPDDPPDSGGNSDVHHRRGHASAVAACSRHHGRWGYHAVSELAAVGIALGG
jgi:hypothetical protein